MGAQGTAQTEARAIAERLSIHHSDADRIAIIATALAAKDAELEAELHMLCLSKATTEAVLERAERAEAQLAEANKALDLALEYWADRQQRYKNRHPAWVQAARRAREQGGQNG